MVIDGQTLQGYQFERTFRMMCNFFEQLHAALGMFFYKAVSLNTF